jgi:glucosamine--fructose-6-phosphate aminotransferase (isomerizing)
MAAIKLAKEKGAFIFGCVTSLVLLSQETHAGAYTHAGPESGILKAFTTQITVLTMIALRLAKAKGPFHLSFHMYLRTGINSREVKEALETMIRQNC